MSAQQCKYHTHPCQLSHRQRVLYHEREEATT